MKDLKKEKELLTMEKEHMEKRVHEVFHCINSSSYFISIFIYIFCILKDHLLFKLVERCQNISVEEYDRMKVDIQQIQVILVLFPFTLLKYIYVLVIWYIIFSLTSFH